MRGLQMESRVNAHARYKEIEEKGTKSGIIAQGSFKIAGVGSTLRSIRFDACEPHILYNTKTQSVLYIHIDPESFSAQLYESTIRNLRHDYKKTGAKYIDQDEAAKKFFADGDIFHFQIIYTYGAVTVSNSKSHTNDERRVRELLTCLNPINDTEHKEVPTCSRKMSTQRIYLGARETQLGSLAVNITSTGLEFHAWLNGDIGEPAPIDAGVLHAEARKAGSSTYHAFIRQINISSDGKNVSQMTNEDKLQPVPLSWNAQNEQKAATTIQRTWRKLHTPENRQKWEKHIADAKIGAGTASAGGIFGHSSQTIPSITTPLLNESEAQKQLPKKKITCCTLL